MSLKEQHDPSSELFLRCDCHGEAMMVEEWDDISFKLQDFYFSYWNSGSQGMSMMWKDRLRVIWKVLTTGRAYSDQVILCRPKVKKLVEYLQQKLEKGKDYDCGPDSRKKEQPKQEEPGTSAPKTSN